MNKYEVIIYWSEEDKSLVSEVPELAGCMTDGKTYMEVMQNTEIAIKEWIETARIIGKKVPKSKGRLVYA